MSDNIVNCKTYSIAGVQFPLDCGISSRGLFVITQRITTNEYDFFRVDAEYSSAYFAFEPNLYEKFESDNLFDEFKKCVVSILNDINLETTTKEYQFKEYVFWLGYDNFKAFTARRYAFKVELSNGYKRLQHNKH